MKRDASRWNGRQATNAFVRMRMRVDHKLQQIL
jgi:hypothetical protein